MATITRQQVRLQFTTNDATTVTSNNELTDNNYNFDNEEQNDHYDIRQDNTHPDPSTERDDNVISSSKKVVGRKSRKEDDLMAKAMNYFENRSEKKKEGC